MTKVFFLSLLLLPTATHCMLTPFKSNVKSKIKLIRKCTTNTHDTFTKEIDDLENQLYRNKWWPYGINEEVDYLVPFRFPKHVYGYTENNGAGTYFGKALIDYDAKTLSEMPSIKKARYNEFSGMGVITLAHEHHEISYAEIKCILKNLRTAGYIPTDKDKKLVRLLEQKLGIILPNGESDLLDRE